MRCQTDQVIFKEKIDKFLKKDCVSCNLKNKTDICDDCIFWCCRDDAYLKKEYINIKISKTYLFYFLYHPELNFTLPSLPLEDYLGNKMNESSMWRWELHHEDGNHWNDEKWNLLLVLNSEHIHLHSFGIPKPQSMRDKLKKGAPGTDNRIKRQLQTRKRNNTLYIGACVPKLTSDEVSIIKRRLIDGESTVELAKEYERGVTTIDNIKHGNSWKNVKPKEKI